MVILQRGLTRREAKGLTLIDENDKRYDIVESDTSGRIKAIVLSNKPD